MPAPGRPSNKRMTMTISAQSRARIAAALCAVQDVQVRFQTALLDPQDHRPDHASHDGQNCRITGTIIDPSDDFDEDGLPYFRAKFEDGVELVVGEEELFSHDARYFAFTSAVCGPFAVSRQLGYAGPFNLHEAATDAQKDAYEQALASFKLSACSQNFNTPAEFRQTTPFEEAISPSYFIAAELEAIAPISDVVTGLQRGFDDGAAGLFQVIPTASPGFMVLFERDAGEDAEFVAQRMMQERLDVKAAAIAQLLAELEDSDLGAASNIVDALRQRGHCFDFGSMALDSITSQAGAAT